MACLANMSDRHAYQVQATVHWIDPLRRYVRAIDPHGAEYFIFYNAFQTTDYRDIGHVELGTHVRGTLIEHPRGRRLIEVEIVEI